MHGPLLTTYCVKFALFVCAVSVHSTYVQCLYCSLCIRHSYVHVYCIYTSHHSQPPWPQLALTQHYTLHSTVHTYIWCSTIEHYVCLLSRYVDVPSTVQVLESILLISTYIYTTHVLQILSAANSMIFREHAVIVFLCMHHLSSTELCNFQICIRTQSENEHNLFPLHGWFFQPKPLNCRLIPMWIQNRCP